MTPAIAQYLDLKKKYPGYILFFRMGDFYETFFDDAKICSRILEITLTSKNDVPMAGVPYHSVDKYIQKLIKHGYKIAIAEQIGEVKPGQLVKRDVVSIITPGTFITENQTDYNYILAITDNEIAFGDISGEYWIYTYEDIKDFQKIYHMINPKEVIIDQALFNKETIINRISKNYDVNITLLNPPIDYKIYVNQYNLSYLRHFKAITLLLKYLEEIKLNPIINKVSYYRDKDIYMDEITFRNLEIFQSFYQDEKYTLWGILNKCITPFGSRYLRYILQNPTQDINLIKKRLDDIVFFRNFKNIEDIKILLKKIYDGPKIISKIIYRKNIPSLYLKLKESIKYGLEIFELLGKKSKIEDFYKIFDILKDNIEDEEINYIKDGVDEKIDYYRNLAFHSDEQLLGYQNELNLYFGNLLKIKFVETQGYVIEVTKKDSVILDKLIKSGDEKFGLIKIQTLKNVERYISPYLNKLSLDIKNAYEELKILEKQYLDLLKSKLQENFNDLIDFFEQLSYIDVCITIASFSDWTVPIVGSNELIIKGGRHPVVENYVDQFVPNDLIMKENKTWIITGPNMGGKSTFLRQNAIIIYLAHCGLLVPAKEAYIPLVDGIFARVGSGDVIGKGQSTFMTEMLELANILNNSTNKSFIIIDELGRGTSTYDGIAIAKASLEYILKTGSYCLFSTHYHELIELETRFKGLENRSVAVYETDNDIVFLRKVVRGGITKSYGIKVAELSGLPYEIIEKAKYYLETYENKNYVQSSLFNYDLEKKIKYLEKENIALKEVIYKIKEFLNQIK